MAKDWVQGICGCTANVPWCVITFCFPCVTSYTVADKIGKKNLAIASVIVFCILTASQVISGACGQMSPKFQAMEQGNYASADTYESDGAYYGAWFFLIAEVVTGIIFIVIVAKMRSHVRETYDVAGDSMADCLLSCFCTSCVLCQMYNHVDHELTQGGTNLGGNDQNIQRV